MNDATNPAEPEVEVPTVDAPENDTPELDEYGNPVEPEGDGPKDPQDTAGDDDSEEIEHEGQKYRIPKALKGSFLMQSDYTRKTQALADDRKAFETEQTQFRNLSHAEVNAQANVIAIDQALKEYGQIDWRAWFESNPQAAQAARLDFDDLKERRQQAVNSFGEAQRSRHAQEAQDTATRLRQGQAELERDIPGWNHEKAMALLDFGQKQFGFSRAELDSITDPRMIKVLNFALEQSKAATQRKATEQAQAKQQVKPASKVGGGSPPPRPLEDRASTEAWMKARQKQVANRR